jgi:hypothetical protein
MVRIFVELDEDGNEDGLHIHWEVPDDMYLGGYLGSSDKGEDNELVIQAVKDAYRSVKGDRGQVADDDIEVVLAWGTTDDPDDGGDMDGDAESALASAGWGTDEDYNGGCFNDE